MTNPTHLQESRSSRVISDDRTFDDSEIVPFFVEDHNPYGQPASWEVDPCLQEHLSDRNQSEWED